MRSQVLPMRLTRLALIATSSVGVLALGGCVDLSGPSPVNATAVVAQRTTLASGDSVQAVAIPASVTGAVISGQYITWQSSNPAVARVSSSGMIVAVGAGSTEITATTEGAAGQLNIAVTQ